MNGRESSRLNDLFFLCSLIEYIGRKTKNERKVVVNALGREGLKHYYDLAEVYHSENMDKVVCEIVEKYGISEGNYDNVSVATEYMPTHWDIGKVMQRLIYKVAKQSKKGIHGLSPKSMTTAVRCIMRIQATNMPLIGRAGHCDLCTMGCSTPSARWFALIIFIAASFKEVR